MRLQERTADLVDSNNLETMPRPIRVFVSSTMTDLANERDAVVRKLQSYNFAPVNAENLLPNGADSWRRIEEELAGSDLVILILGASYGWIPDAGPHASKGKSVTELEFDEAKRLGLPVLPFVQRVDVKLPDDFYNL